MVMYKGTEYGDAVSAGKELVSVHIRHTMYDLEQQLLFATILGHHFSNFACGHRWPPNVTGYLKRAYQG